MFLLCYVVGDRHVSSSFYLTLSVFSPPQIGFTRSSLEALSTSWFPLVRRLSPRAPIVLVGCKVLSFIFAPNQAWSVVNCYLTHFRLMRRDCTTRAWISPTYTRPPPRWISTTPPWTPLCTSRPLPRLQPSRCSLPSR